MSLVLPALLALFLLGFALAAPFLLIAPVYAQPARLANDANVPNPVHIFFDAGDAQPELVGYETTRFLQGNELPLTLYWRTDARLANDLVMYVHVYDAQGNLLGQWDAFPGNGLAPTRLWQPNEILVDMYRIPVKTPQGYPPVARIEVGLSRQGTTRPLTARDPSGNEITPTLTQFKFSQTFRADEKAHIAFADQFDLLDANLRAERGGQMLADAVTTLQAGDVLHLDVSLRAHAIPAGDYVLFAHVTDAQGNIVAQRDAQPLNNSYPTSLWNANETVRDSLRIALPENMAAGEYALEFGVYRADTLARLPLRGDAWSIWQVTTDSVRAPLKIVQ